MQDQQAEEDFWRQHDALLRPHKMELMLCQHLLRLLRARAEPQAQAQVHLSSGSCRQLLSASDASITALHTNGH